MLVSGEPAPFREDRVDETRADCVVREHLRLSP
jgi:hypothetical protein